MKNPASLKKKKKDIEQNQICKTNKQDYQLLVYPWPTQIIESEVQLLSNKDPVKLFSAEDVWECGGWSVGGSSCRHH